MTAGTATGQRDSASADLRARAARWPRSPIFYGIVVAVVAAVAGQWVINPPAAYGLCSACHGRDLENWIINHVYGKQLFVTTAGSHWPLFTVVGVVLGSTLAARRNGELRSIDIGGHIPQFASRRGRDVRRPVRRRLPDPDHHSHRLRRRGRGAHAGWDRRRDRGCDALDALVGAAMTVSLVSLGVGLIVGYLGQRSRMCTIGGLRDYVLVRDTGLLKGVGALLLASWVTFGVLHAIAGSNLDRLWAAGTTPSGMWARRRDPRRRAPPRLLRDALRRLPAAPARPRRAGAHRCVVVPRRLLPRGRRLHELDRAPHRVVAAMSEDIYLDNAATSWPKPPAVLEAIQEFFANAGGNTGRSGHRRSIESSRRVSLARERLADLLGAETPDEVIFTKNATEALNLAILGLAPEGGRIVTTSLEHNSVMRPLRHLEEIGRCTLEIVRADGNTGEIDLDEWSAALEPQLVPGGRNPCLQRHGRAAPDRGDGAARRRGRRADRRRRVAERRAHPARRGRPRRLGGRDARPQGPARAVRHGSPLSRSRRRRRPRSSAAAPAASRSSRPSPTSPPTSTRAGR